MLFYKADLAQMFDYEDYKYFLLVVDAFSSKVFVRPLKSKTSLVVKDAFEHIFQEFNAKIYKLETDRGKGNCYLIYFSFIQSCYK